MSSIGDRVETFCQGWISSLALLLSQLAGADWQVAMVAAPNEFAPAACLRIAVEGGVEGRQWVKVAAADVETLLRLFLGEEGKLTGEVDDTQKQALQELGAQWSGLAATALEADFGKVRLLVTVDDSCPPAHALSRFLSASDGSCSITVQLDGDDALAASLGGDNPAVDTPPARASAPAAPETDSPAGAPARVVELLRRGNLELLMDVELPVMLRFGSRQSTLREVLELAAGAVLELDREIQEPVDLVLNDKVIARGEVVVIDGNYGLRVLEVASPQQRVNSL